MLLQSRPRAPRLGRIVLPQPGLLLDSFEITARPLSRESRGMHSRESLQVKDHGHVSASSSSQLDTTHK